MMVTKISYKAVKSAKFKLPSMDRCNVPGVVSLGRLLIFMHCQEPMEFNLFLQTQLKWNQRIIFKSNGLFPSKDEIMDVFLGE